MPTIDIPDKICSHCGGTRWRVEYEKRPYWIRTKYRCAKRAQERIKQWELNHPEKMRELWKKKNKKTSCKKRQLEKYNYDRDNLTDRYVKHLIVSKHGISRSDVPQELIELKRKQLLLKRKIKNNGKK